MVVYLVPAGRDRYELYSESAEPPPDVPPSSGWWSGWLVRAREQWRELAARAERSGEDEDARGWLTRGRDWLVRSLAESIAQQRTLWALRLERTATARVPIALAPDAARAWIRAEFARARRHHLRWFVVDGAIFVASGVLALVPGPNLLAYYFAFRLVGHLQSWRGARQGMDRIEWQFTGDPDLDELSALVDLPRDVRAPRVAAIAERLGLSRLAAFFDRVAVPGA